MSRVFSVSNVCLLPVASFDALPLAGLQALDPGVDGVDRLQDLARVLLEVADGRGVLGTVVLQVVRPNTGLKIKHNNDIIVRNDVRIVSNSAHPECCNAGGGVPVHVAEDALPALLREGGRATDEGPRRQAQTHAVLLGLHGARHPVVPEHLVVLHSGRVKAQLLLEYQRDEVNL